MRLRLTDYAGQFDSNPNRLIVDWISMRSTISIIEMWELTHENPNFRKNNVDYFITQIQNNEKINVEELVAALNLESINIENHNIAADKAIYYDFVQYLTEKKLNVNQ